MQKSIALKIIALQKKTVALSSSFSGEMELTTGEDVSHSENMHSQASWRTV